MRAMLGWAVGLLLTAAGATAHPPALDCPRHYVLLFAADAGPLRLDKTHTWAIFARVTGGPESRVVEPTVVSWLPADGTIDSWRPLRPEPGRLYSHADTLRFAADAGEKVTAFEPVEISAERYAAAMAEVARMRAGRVAYVAADGHPRGPADACNCIVAVIRCDPELRKIRHRWTQLGSRGTASLHARWLATGAVPAPDVAEWLVPAVTAAP